MPNQQTWERHGARQRFWGNVSYADLAAANQAFDGNPRASHAKYKLIDLTEAESSDFDTAHVLEMAAVNYGSSLYLKSVKEAIIVRDETLAERFCDYASLMARLKSSWKVRLFTSEEDALDWIEPMAEIPVYTRTLEAGILAVKSLNCSMF